MPTLVLALIAIYAIFFWLVHAVVTGEELGRKPERVVNGPSPEGEVKR